MDICRFSLARTQPCTPLSQILVVTDFLGVLTMMSACACACACACVRVRVRVWVCMCMCVCVFSQFLINCSLNFSLSHFLTLCIFLGGSLSFSGHSRNRAHVGQHFGAHKHNNSHTNLKHTFRAKHRPCHKQYQRGERQWRVQYGTDATLGATARRRAPQYRRPPFRNRPIYIYIERAVRELAAGSVVLLVPWARVITV